MRFGLFCVTPSRISIEKELLAIVTNDPSGQLSPTDMKTLIEESLDSDKGFDIITIDLQGQNAMADYMVIASGTSSRHVHGLANKVKDKLSANGVKGVRTEGISQSDWVVLDAGDVIIHLFRPEVREFYNMEKMWLPLPAGEVAQDQLPA